MDSGIIICIGFCVFLFMLGYAIGFNRGYWKAREEVKNEKV